MPPPQTPRTPSSKNSTVKTPRSSKFHHHNKVRMKVGIRCRPPFQDEVDFAEEGFESIIDMEENAYSNTKSGNEITLSRVSLTMITGKRRDFQFDYAFDPSSDQDYVYDKLARPIVDDVLKGFNGTIFAYGQTGTGKTYTMGILETVNNDHAGIIPRSIAQIFDHVASQDTAEISVSLSFLQLYRETIHDLLIPALGTNQQVGDESLTIREDPQRGFYVEGLQEFLVNNYAEAEVLLNLGLENRAIASTVMNVTSSRSHTVLTLNLAQRFTNDKNDNGGSSKTGYSRNIKSKLVMVDLAGSERVRRTVSKGARLSEAKSINTSLSALGNVIAALAESNTSHVPYRDSKLTRLLQDSLGGTASTALMATVGPAAVNYGETLSTLLFATRCMAVKSNIVQHEEVDYAEMCARLQEKLSNYEGIMMEKLHAQQQQYEEQITNLKRAIPGGTLNEEVGEGGSTAPSALNASELEQVLVHLATVANGEGSGPGWLQVATRSDPMVVSLLAYSYQLLVACQDEAVALIQANELREEEIKQEMVQKLSDEAESEILLEEELQEFQQHDPLKDSPAFAQVGSHLAGLSKLQAAATVQGQHQTNNSAVNGHGGQPRATRLNVERTIDTFESPEELAEALATLHGAMEQNVRGAALLLGRKDSHFKELKWKLADQIVERRKREEEVVNWSYILKYLLETQSKLREDLRGARKQAASAPAPLRNSSSGSKGNLTVDTRSPGTSNAINSASGVTDGDGSSNSGGGITPAQRDSISRRVEAVRSAIRPASIGSDGDLYANENLKNNILTDSGDSGVGVKRTNSGASLSTLGMPSISSVSSPSAFAQTVVRDLGLERNEAPVAMSVIDRVSNITSYQLERLDDATRTQVLEIRAQLGLKAFASSNMDSNGNSGNGIGHGYEIPGTAGSSGTSHMNRSPNSRMSSMGMDNYSLEHDDYSQL